MSKFLNVLVSVAMVMMFTCTFALAEGQYDDLILQTGGISTNQQAGVGSSGTSNASGLFAVPVISVAAPTPAPAPTMPMFVMPAFDWTAFFNMFTPTAASAAPSVAPASSTAPGGVGPKSGWSGAMNVGSSGVPYSSDYNQVKAAIKTPTQASAYMEENFRYEQDFRNGAYTAVSPATTNSGKWGDCKDFTVFMNDVLADDGIQVQPVTVRYGTSTGTFHVMSVITYNGTAYLQSNQDIWKVGSGEEILSIASRNLPNGASNLRYYPSGQTDFRP